jgi:hypothetical protein
MLSERRKGRLEQLRDAVANRQLGEPGLIAALVGSLDDRHGDVAEYVATIALPAIGARALPSLKHGFNGDGNAADALRLISVRAIDRSKRERWPAWRFLRHTSGSEPRRIATLSGSADHAELILSFIESRSSHVRLCAFSALSGIRSNNVVTRVCVQFRKGVRDGSVGLRKTCERSTRI